MNARREAEATRRLREAGGFRSGTGVLSSRRVCGLRRREIPFQDLDGIGTLAMDPNADRPGVDLAREVEILGRRCGLTPGEREAVTLACLEGCSLREAAGRLGVTVYRVWSRVRWGLRKCRERGPAAGGSLRALFYEEIRRRRRAVYRHPRRLWG
jgi:hypothetical protein